MRSEPRLGSEFQDNLSPLENIQKDLAAMASATRTMKQFKSRMHRSTSNPQPAPLPVAKSARVRSVSLGLAYAKTRERLYTHPTQKLATLVLLTLGSEYGASSSVFYVPDIYESQVFFM